MTVVVKMLPVLAAGAIALFASEDAAASTVYWNLQTCDAGDVTQTSPNARDSAACYGAVAAEDQNDLNDNASKLSTYSFYTGTPGNLADPENPWNGLFNAGDLSLSWEEIAKVDNASGTSGGLTVTFDGSSGGTWSTVAGFFDGFAAYAIVLKQSDSFAAYGFTNLTGGAAATGTWASSAFDFTSINWQTIYDDITAANLTPPCDPNGNGKDKCPSATDNRGGLSHFTIYGVRGTPPVPILETAPIPLPATGWLLVAGLGGLAALRRRKR